MREQFLELLRTDPKFREEVRLLILTEDLLTLPSRIDRLVEAVHELTVVQRQQAERVLALTEAQRRTEEQLQRQVEQILALTEAQRRTEEQLQKQAEQILALTEAQRRTEEQLQRQTEQIQALIEGLQELRQRVNELVTAQHRMEEALTWFIDWQRGEVGRKEGERYERQVIRRAPILFNGGYGGPPDNPSVQQRLAALLPPEQRERLFHNDEDDPFLSDLIWWKGEKLAVVEISLQVDGYDVTRAERRAATLREVGVSAIGVVIGKEWAYLEAHDVALRRGVEWVIGKEMSEGFKKFREELEE